MTLEKHFYRPLRKFRELGNLSVSDIRAYAAGPLNKLTSRFHMKRVKELPSCSIDQEQFLRTIWPHNASIEASYTSELGSLFRKLEPYLLRDSTSDAQLVRLLYIVARLTKPDSVLETGVWHGVSSFVLLSALEANGGGRLDSIDLPPMDPKTRVDVGSAVPVHLRARWRLTKGSARSALPAILTELRSCDLFVHDGEHTYNNMMFEFRQVWPFLKSGGLIIVDDAHWNDSVLDFRDEVNCSMWSMERKKGGFVVVLRKPS